jgi:hypothetical protein
MSEIVSTIREVATDFWNLKEMFAKAKQEKREKIAVYFEQISECLMITAAILRENKYPYGSCAQMGIFANMLPKVIDNILNSEKTTELSDKLRSAQKLEQLFHDLSVLNASDREEQLGNLEGAAGVFLAMAKSVRAI